MNEKRKTIAAAAASDGPSSGSVISRNRRNGPAPSVAAASDTRGSRRAQNPPTTRTTTATLKKVCATRIAAQPCSRPAGRIARNASATTIVGRTNGTVTSARTSPRPGNANRPSTYAAGNPTTRVSAVDASACQIVNHTTSRVSGSVSTSNGDASAPSVRSPRSRIEASGNAKKSARNASGTPTVSARQAAALTEARSPSTP